MSAVKAVPLHRRLAAARETHWGSGIAAAAVPFLFLHIRYQPGFHVHAGSTNLGVQASDLAVLVVLVAGAVALRDEAWRLRRALPVWLAGAAVIVWIAAEALRTRDLAHVVSAAKFCEYAVLALALPLLLRRRGDVRLFAATLVAWSCVATLVGLLQYLGVPVFHAWEAGRRQPSFLSQLDFAALSGAALAAALVSFALPLLPRRLAAAALGSGILGLVIAGGTAGAIGIALVAGGLAAVAARRGLLRRGTIVPAVAALVLVAGGVAAIRGNDFDQFLRFAGVRKAERSTRTRVQTYAQHTLLAYIGFEIFRAHPVAGVGWEGSNDPKNYRPTLPAAHRRFPDVAEIAYPAPSRPYGVQNAYVQVLADLGVVGFLLWAALYVAALFLAARTALRAPPLRAAVAAAGGASLLLTLGLWIPANLVAGLPLDALLWLAFGLVAAAPALDE